MRILTVAADLPVPPVGGARTRNHHLLRALAGAHDVVVAAFDFGGAYSRNGFPADIRAVPWDEPAAMRDADEDGWRRLGAAEAEPYGVVYYESPAMEAAIARAIDEGVDAAVLTESPMARFAPLLGKVPWVLDLHDVQARKVGRGGDPGEAERWRRFETAAAAAAARTVCVSDTEARAAGLLGAGRVEVVPNGVDTAYFTPCATPGDEDRVVFTGSLHTTENVAAAQWLVHEVWPRLRERRPGIRLDLVGRTPAGEVLALAGASVAVHADVPDVRPYLQRAAVAVAPIRSGGGTRLKILEAAACGRAVVTTTAGVEGLDLRGGRDLVVADDAAAFAEAVAALCADSERRAELGRAARRAALRYDWGRIGRRWRALVEEVARR